MSPPSQLPPPAAVGDTASRRGEVMQKASWQRSSRGRGDGRRQEAGPPCRGGGGRTVSGERGARSEGPARRGSAVVLEGGPAAPPGSSVASAPRGSCEALSAGFRKAKVDREFGVNFARGLGRRRLAGARRYARGSIAFAGSLTEEISRIQIELAQPLLATCFTELCLGN